MEGFEMTKAQILKKEILSQYRSVRQFALEMQIPYSTLVTADNPFIRSIHLSGQPVICYLRRRKTASGTYNSALHIFLQLSGDV